MLNKDGNNKSNLMYNLADIKDGFKDNNSINLENPSIFDSFKYNARMPKPIGDYFKSCDESNMSDLGRKIIYDYLKTDSDFKEYFYTNFFNVEEEFRNLLSVNDYKLLLKIVSSDEPIRFAIAKYWFPNCSKPKLKNFTDLLEIFVTDEMICKLTERAKVLFLESK